jgi:hypothetical protein
MKCFWVLMDNLPQLQQSSPKLTPVFNALSGADKLKLRSVAGLKAFSAIVREDTRHSPWKFPLYVGYVGVMAIPLPGTHVVPLGLLFGWYALGLTERSRWAKDQIKEKFTPANLVNDNQAFIVEDPEDPKKFKVQGMALAVDGNKTAWNDLKESGRIFKRSVRNYFLK